MDNLLGLLALATYAATLLPSNLKIVFPSLRPSSFVKLLLQHRRSIGIWTFFLSVAHTCLVIHTHRIDLSDASFYRQSASGLAVLAIFLLLTITSNNWSMRMLKRNWKRLHGLTYLAVFLLPWHITDKMEEHWSPITPVGIGLIFLLIYSFIVRRHKETAAKSA